MKNLQRIVIIGFAAGGMALLGSAAASADTYHYGEKTFAGSDGGGYKGWATYIGPGGWKHGKAFHHNWGAIATEDGGATWEKFAFAE